jgi:hypothetical protein
MGQHYSFISTSSPMRSAQCFGSDTFENRQLARKKLLLQCDILSWLGLIEAPDGRFLVWGLTISGNNRLVGWLGSVKIVWAHAAPG